MPSAPNHDPNKKLGKAAEAALKLAAQTPWARVSARAIADAAELALADLYELGGKAALLEAIDAKFDAAMGLDMPELSPDASDVERRSYLAEVMMQRFDAMETHRQAVLNIQSFYEANPSEMARVAVRRGRSARWALFTAGIDEAAMGLKAVVIAGIFLRANGIWRDDVAPCERTMAAIDGDLRQLENWRQDFERLGDMVQSVFSGGKKKSASEEGWTSPEENDPEPENQPSSKPPPPL